MPVTDLSPTSRSIAVGDVWPISVLVLDADGDTTADTVTVTVTPPVGAPTTAAVETLADGVYRALYPITVAGRHTAQAVSAEYGACVFVAFAAGVTVNADMPTVQDVDDYLTSGTGEHSWTTDDMAGALAAEEAAQRRVCKIGAFYPADLREALLRRVQRNLAMRPNALAILRGDADGGDSTTLPQNDPEVRRLERPYRKLPLG